MGTEVKNRFLKFLGGYSPFFWGMTGSSAKT
jgi:hypothetical protein